MQKTILIILLVVSYVYSLVIVPALAGSSNSLARRLTQLHESCVWNTKNIAPKLSYRKGRGSQYYIGSMDSSKMEMLKHCVATFWSMSHLFLYVLIGYFCPDYARMAFFIGAGFELYEYFRFECHDVLDLAWNAVGLFLGLGLRGRG
jgi:hypothetical protein